MFSAKKIRPQKFFFRLKIQFTVKISLYKNLHEKWELFSDLTFNLLKKIHKNNLHEKKPIRLRTLPNIFGLSSYLTDNPTFETHFCGKNQILTFWKFQFSICNWYSKYTLSVVILPSLPLHRMWKLFLKYFTVKSNKKKFKSLRWTS